ncbi:MAG: hypothetical protein O7F08_03395 [Deltaproteobacteria bacterium]|nr:hypothetical protein [Deltaproteobacteria bacterium]
MKLHAIALFSVLLLTACTEKDEAPQVLAPLPPGPPIEPPDRYLHSPSRFGVVHLHAGFNPDPRVVEGTAIGQVPASSIHRKCKGWIAEKPDYLLAADTAFLQLHVLGRSRGDVSLVVRKPDASVVCNDNRNGTRDPMIRSDFPIGSSQIWVGVRNKGASIPYSLAFSEVKWRSSTIPLPEEN